MTIRGPQFEGFVLLGGIVANFHVFFVAHVRHLLSDGLRLVDRFANRGAEQAFDSGGSLHQRQRVRIAVCGCGKRFLAVDALLVGLLTFFQIRVAHIFGGEPHNVQRQRIDTLR